MYLQHIHPAAAIFALAASLGSTLVALWRANVCAAREQEALEAGWTFAARRIRQNLKLWEVAYCVGLLAVCAWLFICAVVI